MIGWLKDWWDVIRAARSGLDPAFLREYRYLKVMGVDPSDLTEREIRMVERLVETAQGLTREEAYDLDTALHEVARAALYVENAEVEVEP